MYEGEKQFEKRQRQHRISTYPLVCVFVHRCVGKYVNACSPQGMNKNSAMIPEGETLADGSGISLKTHIRVSDSPALYQMSNYKSSEKWDI